MPTSKWTPWPGAFRAAGDGPLGVHYGKPVWTLEAALERRESLSSHNPRTWVETFVGNTWKRLGDPVTSPEPERSQP